MTGLCFLLTAISITLKTVSQKQKNQRVEVLLDVLPSFSLQNRLIPSQELRHHISACENHHQRALSRTGFTFSVGFRHMVTHFPSTAISCTEVAPCDAQVSHVDAADSQHGCANFATPDLRNVHISAQLMEDFLEIARNNTDKDLETCGVLGAFLKEEILYATTLIVPKQESTSSSALNEADIFNIQNDRSLIPVGWIHTHPSQSCFMSSIDLHTQFPYQVMVPEAVAIVVAPSDKIRSYGIFRLTDPSGMRVLRDCQEKGFHPHQDPNDGRPLYEQCSHVYINPNLRFEIFDLR